MYSFEHHSPNGEEWRQLTNMPVAILGDPTLPFHTHFCLSILPPHTYRLSFSSSKLITSQFGASISASSFLDTSGFVKSCGHVRCLCYFLSKPMALWHCSACVTESQCIVTISSTLSIHPINTSYGLFLLPLITMWFDIWFDICQKRMILMW